MSFIFDTRETHCALSKYIGEDTVVVIPNSYEGLPVTEIGSKCFEKNISVHEVVMPPTISKIGAGAFRGCKYLSHCGLSRKDNPSSRFPIAPISLQDIGEYAFYDTGLIGMIFKAKNLNIGRNAFAECHELKYIAAEKCTSAHVESGAFRHSSLESINMPKIDISQFPSDSFEGCAKLCSIIKKDKPSKASDFAMLEPDIPDNILEWLSSDDLLEETTDNKAITTSLSNSISLFTMHPLTNTEVVFHQESFSGRLIENNIGISFLVQRTPTFPSVTFRCVFSDSHDIEQLIQNIAEGSYIINIEGKWEKDEFQVFNIRPSTDDVRLKGITSGFFMMLLQRMGDKNTPPNSFALQTINEIDLWFKLCGDTLPKWVIDAYRRNKDILDYGLGSRSSSEERQHARKTIEIIANINWKQSLRDMADTSVIGKRLDQSFYGLDAVKKRILEVTAQIRRTHRLPKWGILLHGPAGIGKTSFAKWIANTLSLPLIEIDIPSIGKDAETIAGSSRIYSNARPGMLVTSMWANRSSTAVLLINELDKLNEQKTSGVDTLLSILDKTGMYENFLEEVLPTDNLFCIGTCNDLEKISQPMRDRFLIIDLPGYTSVEKGEIWKRHILPKALSEADISPQDLIIEPDALKTILSEYAFDPGVRDLEKIAERLVGDYCLNVESNNINMTQIYSVSKIQEILGHSKKNVRSFINVPGMVPAAYTFDGTAHFFMVEASMTPGTGKFEVLGPTAKVQEEYAKVAYLSYARTKSYDFSKVDVAIFIPQCLPMTSINYVGFAVYCALHSLCTNRCLPINDLVFVGGCDLNGSLYFDDAEIDSILKSMGERNIKSLVAPTGGHWSIPETIPSVAIIEGINAKDLVEIAMV